MSGESHENKAKHGGNGERKKGMMHNIKKLMRGSHGKKKHRDKDNQHKVVERREQGKEEESKNRNEDESKRPSQSESKGDKEDFRDERKTMSTAEPVKAEIHPNVRREKPVQKFPVSRKFADIFLWRDKKISAGVLGIATAIWVFFELLEFYLLKVVAHILIPPLSILFLWSSACRILKKLPPPKLPDVVITNDIVVDGVSALRIQLNRALAILRDIASGKYPKKFIAVVAGLLVLGYLGSCCNFLTLFYICFVLLHTMPVLYKKYQDKIDAFVEKSVEKFKKPYAYRVKALRKNSQS